MIAPISVEPLPAREYIEALQRRHITVEQIAEALGISVRTVFYLKNTDHEPLWSTGRALIELYTMHCSTASNRI